MAAKTKEVLTIETELINKQEIFRMLVLAHCTKLPLLLVGKPGVGKTAIVMGYARAFLNMNIDTSDPVKVAAAEEEFVNRIFMIETDEGTKSSDIKGMADLEKLFKEDKFELYAPITQADVVIINEVDKASSAIRNSLLGIMNEKFLFTGKHKIPCKWQLFIATCNEIPKDELNSPFWDRFVLKSEVNRVTAGDLTRYFSRGGKKYKEQFKVNMPDVEEIDAISVSERKMDKFLDVAYTECTDRTLTFVPTLARAVSLIWEFSMDKSLVKVASIMLSQSMASKLQDKLTSSEVKALLSKIDMTYSINTSAGIDTHVQEIEKLITQFAQAGKLDEEEVTELETSLEFVISQHPIKQRGGEIEDMLKKALGSNPMLATTDQDKPPVYYKNI